MKPVKLIARDSGPLLSFDTMKEARRLKGELKRLTTNDSQYYACLARFELGHFDQIATVALEKGKEPAAYAKEVLNALQMEINAAAWAGAEDAPTDTPKTKKNKSKLFLKFNSEGAFDEVREHLKILTGSDDYYHKVMAAYGYKTPSDIPTHEDGIKPYRDLCTERNRVQLEHETIAAAAKHVGMERAPEVIITLRRTYDLLGPGPFFAVLDEHGCPTIDDAIRSYRLGEIMAKLKDVVDYRNRS